MYFPLLNLYSQLTAFTKCKRLFSRKALMTAQVSGTDLLEEMALKRGTEGKVPE